MEPPFRPRVVPLKLEEIDMPLLLWLLGVPGIIVILLWITGIIGF